jgi:hypothetical protein
MSNYTTHIEYTDIRTYIKNHINKKLYEFEGFYIYKKLGFFRKKEIGQFYALIYNIGNDYMVESSDKEFLDHIKPICTQYEKLTNYHYHFEYRLNVFKEIE